MKLGLSYASFRVIRGRVNRVSLCHLISTSAAVVLYEGQAFRKFKAIVTIHSDKHPMTSQQVDCFSY